MAGQGASLAIGGLVGLVRGVGAYQGTRYEAEKAKRAGDIAKVQADQVDAQYREDLNATISNIRAIRASVGMDPDSPSARAYVAEEERVSSRERRIRAGGLRMQAEQDYADAKFLRRSAKWSLLGGIAGGLAGG